MSAYRDTGLQGSVSAKANTPRREGTAFTHRLQVFLIL